MTVTADGGPLERLYHMHVPRATRIAYLLVDDSEVARELAHEAYLKTTLRFHVLRNRQAFGAYMTRTVINLSKRYRKRRDRERQYLDREFAGPPARIYLPDLEARDELLSALRRLPYRQRAALVLRFFADLPDADIADAIGSSPGTVRSLISRGLATLRKMMGEGS